MIWATASKKLQQTGNRAMNSATSKETEETHGDLAFCPAMPNNEARTNFADPAFRFNKQFQRAVEARQSRVAESRMPIQARRGKF
jgi:hypothetical protein